VDKIKEVKDLSVEIKNNILLNILRHKRRNHKLEKSKQQIYKFIKYNEMDNLSYNIDFDKYRIGDCISHRGKTNYSFREKKLYLRGWCIKCKGPNNELSDICKSCREVKKHCGMAILADTGYKICINCYERFKYSDWNKDIYCLWCQDLRIFYNLDNKKMEEEIIKEPDKINKNVSLGMKYFKMYKEDKNRKDNNINSIKSDNETEEDNFIKCLKCNSYIPDIVKDKLCCRCGSIDEYWD
jgi:hypothetical protein